MLWDSASPQRKRRYTWRAIRLGNTWVGTDTHLANELVFRGVEQGLLPTFSGFHVAQREPSTKKGRRLDFKLWNGNRECFVEVKSVMVAVGRVARFPDSISPRAVAHLKDLAKLANSGKRAVFVLLIQRGDVDRIEINQVGDPLFTRAAKSAMNAGVELVAIKHPVNANGFREPLEVPVVID